LLNQARAQSDAPEVVFVLTMHLQGATPLRAPIIAGMKLCEVEHPQTFWGFSPVHQAQQQRLVDNPAIPEGE
jgi:hypothetical protein